MANRLDGPIHNFVAAPDGKRGADGTGQALGRFGLPRTTRIPTTDHLRGHHDGLAGHDAAQCKNYEKQISPDKPAFTGERTAADRALVITAIFS